MNDVVTNRNPAEWLNAQVELETEGSTFRRDVQTGIPGEIIAQFTSSSDAVLFSRLKGADSHIVTAGISHSFAVRRIA